MAERHGQFFEIALGQLRQDFEVDLVLAKRRLVLSEAERPSTIVRHPSPRRSSREIIPRIDGRVQAVSAAKPRLPCD